MVEEVYKCDKFIKAILKWVKFTKHCTLSMFYKNDMQNFIYLKLILNLPIN